MKTCIFIIGLLSCINCSAQERQEFYDWEWKPCAAGKARFVAIIKKTDSGWLRNDFFLAKSQLQMAGLYADSATKIENGVFNYFYASDVLKQTGQYVNGKKEGIWLSYFRNGMMSDSVQYANGIPVGTRYGWHQNGYMSDSTVYKPGAPAVAVYWYDNGAPSAAGHFNGDKLYGPWTYFHKNGNPAAKEVYNNGKLTSRVYFDEAGREEADTANKDRDAMFPGGSAAWKKFMLRQIYFPDQYQLVNTDVITVVVSAMVDEDGNVSDIAVDIPFNDAFDRIALAVFKKTPKWLPAIRHNRKVRQGIRQPISFAQQQE